VCVDYSREKLKWNGWGWLEQDFDLHGREEGLWEFLQAQLGIDDLPDTPAVPLEEMPLPENRLSESQIEDLRGLLSADRVHVDRYERLFHAFGKSYHDLIRLRRGEIDEVPDAVVYPQSADELVALTQFATTHHLALVPYGGGSSVVGGVEALAGRLAGVITVDLSRMNRVLSLDEESLTATAEAGIYGPQLEEHLQKHGYTLGHYPQSFQFSTLGGWIAARGAGQQSNRYGAATKFFAGATVVTPSGILHSLATPNSAAGPDLRHLIAGSEGVFGFITEATVRLRPLPTARDYRGFLFSEFKTGADVVREIIQEHVDVAMLRLSDAGETWFLSQFKSIGKPASWASKATSAALDLVGVGENPCLMLVGLEGTTTSTSASRVAIARIAMGAGGIPIGAKPGKGWYGTRFDMPYLRDALLDRGVGVDTLETATNWSNLHHLHQTVRKQIATSIRRHTHVGTGEPIVMAHISHSYPDGASLYFTFIFPVALEKPVAQWKAIKREVSDSILENGGTISHHHGVGTDHRDWMEGEKGELGVAMLKAVRDSVDPHGLMNPGKLLP
jgi:alkyldihydroxyacetonephosphate synthase